MNPAVIFPIAFLAACSIAIILKTRHGPVKETGLPPSQPARPGGFSLAVLGAAVACLLLLLSPAASRADIYQWEDSQGTVHFTDDVTTIPAKYRKPEKASPSPGMKQAPLPGSAQEAAREEELASLVEQQKAKIAAKEEHIRAVDAKRSLAVNPLRNRYVDQADLDLYDKYKDELPEDKERLRELETSLSLWVEEGHIRRVQQESCPSRSLRRHSSVPPVPHYREACCREVSPDLVALPPGDLRTQEREGTLPSHRRHGRPASRVRVTYLLSHPDRLSSRPLTRQ
jgi:hypothetical protein